ncbi:peptidase domain-containing ABC transporter [Novosphingobium sp.]|uniref:peptidase domain-containing ABC transporter n=1 Tax=Novosphingobium sp. TaxID=1874826 RepID=UPI0022C5C610|nr:peptidase domain-containing ABC transporter [Novosphingobium sp.]MCZ8018553.1 peptidase domain-containing ABC transporter [Novosphingobium sp.]MCZ8036014.1 peptidase domain-containing ABC transporter [Novosphingobium sp.]MCZ8050302.1 peptidase domain-containing ABC transporter [Novosphingobium sp.]MCZ8060891.1 peptidase domain-containing ABC transporter [Novosphingobium sp.]MCZ8233138.1 peptidase domain-containing ABC transporter [Novosphingobium sp.]
MSDFDWPWTRRMAPILQSEAAECGLASLAMVARHFGHRVDLAGLRRRFPTSLDGLNLRQLMAAASALDLAPRAVRLEVEELDQLALPAILHWDLNHFVVLESVSARSVVVLDPARGRVRIAASAIGRHFTGVALELTPTPDFKPIEARVQTRLTDLWSQLTNFRSAIAQVLFLSLLVQLASLASPLFMQMVVDDAVNQGDSSLLTVLLLGFGFIYLLQSVTRFLRTWVTICLGQSLTFQLAGNLMRHLLRLPATYFERRHVGDIMSRLGAVGPIQSLLTHGLVDTVIDTTLVLATLVVMFMISVPLALIGIGATLFYLLVTQLVHPTLRRLTEEQIVAQAQEETYVMESLRAMRAIKLHGFEATRESGWRNHFAEVISAGYKAQMANQKVDFLEDITSNLAFLLTVYFGALAVISQELTVGTLLAFLSYRSTFSGSARALVRQWQKWRLLSVHLQRLSDIVGEPREQLAPVVPRRTAIRPPTIRARDLTFAYSAQSAPVLERVSFDIPAGSLVAIVGPSGAGKTTLMRLLLGLLTPQGGALEIDGTPLNATSLAGWRARVGAVMQDDYLLSGSLADNIAFFDPHPDQQRIEQAARFAQIHDDIARMPMGYHSLVSDMGVALSSGQRQRMLLARAVYRQPDMLILDEGTANLDSQTEEVLARSIAAWPITRIAISHRPALVRLADIVLEVDGGQVHVRTNAQSGFAASARPATPTETQAQFASGGVS